MATGRTAANLKMPSSLDKAVICVVGLGYVGLPLAEAFAKSNRVIGFDVDGDKVSSLRSGNNNHNVVFSHDPADLSQADFIIVCVPTPLTRTKQPSLRYIKSAAELIARNMKRGCTVILESSVYPGVTEEVLKPALEKTGLRCGVDFRLAYSPERINPGDDLHTVERVTKVVAGMDEETTGLVAALYQRVTPSVFKARNIKTAEATKATENIQRDVNIAVINELSMIFDRLGINTRDVLDAAATKWNFHRYSPGLVGGHCIPVVPQYMAHKARQLGYEPRLILAGRAVNDQMPRHIAALTIRALKEVGKDVAASTVLLMGLTYKENAPDARESPATEIARALVKAGARVYGYDPLVDEVEDDAGITIVRSFEGVPKADALVLTVAHDEFRRIRLDDLKKLMNPNPVLVDIKQVYDGEEARALGFCYKTL